jgi:hypothetical protein
MLAPFCGETQEARRCSESCQLSPTSSKLDNSCITISIFRI